MATVPHHLANPQTTDRNAAIRRQPKVRKRRLGRVALALAMTALLLVVFAPTIACYTPLGAWAIERALGADATVRFESLSIGWFSPLAVRQLEIRDGDDELLLTATGITGDRSLLAILKNSSELSAVRIDEPHLHIELRPDGSNVEDFVLPWLPPPDEPRQHISVVAEIHEGRITVVDRAIGRQWHIEDFAMRLAASADSAASLELKTSGSIPAGMETCQFTADLKLPLGQPGPGDAAVNADNFPLLMVQSLIERFAAGNKLYGTLTTEMKCRWGDDANQLTVEGATTIDQLQLVSPLFSGDQLRLEKLQVPCKLTMTGDQLTVHNLALQSDVGQLQAQGTVRLPVGDRPSDLATLARENFAVEGRLDLARLSKLLPATLHIRQDTSITAGTVELQIRSRGGKPGDGHSKAAGWEGRFEMSPLTAESGGRQFTWDQPLTIRFAAHEEPQGMYVDQFVCESNFIAMNAAGSGRQLNAQVRFDLGQLADRLGQFVDLAACQLAGTGEVQVQCTQAADEPRQTTASLTLGNFRLQVPGQLSVEGNCQLYASGSYSSSQKAVEVRECRLNSQQFRLHGCGLTIVEPAMTLNAAGKWTATTARLDVSHAELACEALRLVGDKIALELPKTKKTPTLSGEVTFEGQIDRLHQWIQPPVQNGWLLLGSVEGQCSLTYEGSQMGAVLRLKVRDLAMAELLPNAQGRLKPEVLWREPKLGVAASASYDTTADRLSLGDTQIVSQSLNLKATGSVDQVRTERKLDLAGNIDYDLAQLALMLRPYLGEGITAQGRDSAQFKLRGPLATALAANEETGNSETGAPDTGAHWAQQLTGELGLGWNQIVIHGLAIEQGRIDAKLDRGLVRTAPLDLAISEGRFTSAPVVRLDPSPLEMQLPAGPLLTQVRISPEMCDKALKYVAPVLADATRTEGFFSVELEGGRVPLALPEQSDLAGKLTVHRVEVLPGPLAKDLILLGKQIESILNRRPPPLSLANDPGALVRVRDQIVPFRMVEGRVHHQRLELMAGNVAITTQGSVGLDQTLALLADIPVQEKWLGSDPVLQGFKGQTLRVPIGGSLSQPKIDGRVLEQLAGQLVRGAAQKVIGQEIDKQLNRLFQQDK